ncbi:hypothetical protein MFRU_007g00490 [Monilinia fructicola]|nr:hypothetical protein MFRU_007g00490 [Monilinia fructicola]
MTATSHLDAWRGTSVESQVINPILNTLPVETISMILTFVCTSDYNVTSCALSNFKHQTEYPMWKNQQRYCDCYRNFLINPVLVKTLKDTAAVSLTCRAFYNIVSGDALLYKHNTIEFCTLNDAERCLEKIPKNKRNAIESIRIHYRFTKIFRTPLTLESLTSVASSAFEAIGNCARVKSLAVCPDGIPAFLARHRIEIHELPGLRAWVDIRGLQRFQMNIGTASMSVWVYRQGRPVNLDFSSEISWMEKKIRALVIHLRVTEKEGVHPVISNLNLQELFAVPKLL